MAALDVRVMIPPARTASNTIPEQQFAVAWSACFKSAISLAVRARKDRVSENRSVSYYPLYSDLLECADGFASGRNPWAENPPTEQNRSVPQRPRFDRCPPGLLHNGQKRTAGGVMIRRAHRKRRAPED